MSCFVRKPIPIQLIQAALSQTFLDAHLFLHTGAIAYISPHSFLAKTLKDDMHGTYQLWVEICIIVLWVEICIAHTQTVSGP